MKPYMKVDRLGRVVVPYWYRKRHNIEVGSAVEIFIDEGMVCIKYFDSAELNLKRFVGIVRRLDDLCRVTIPQEFFSTLSWRKNEVYYMSLFKDSYFRDVIAIHPI